MKMDAMLKRGKLSRCYSGTCECGASVKTFTPDGRTKSVNRTCESCGSVMRLWRNAPKDRPLLELTIKPG